MGGWASLARASGSIGEAAGGGSKEEAAAAGAGRLSDAGASVLRGGGSGTDGWTGGWPARGSSMDAGVGTWAAGSPPAPAGGGGGGGGARGLGAGRAGAAKPRGLRSRASWGRAAAGTRLPPQGQPPRRLLVG